MARQTASRPSAPTAAARRPVLRFLIIFAAALAALYALTASPLFRQSLFPAYLEFNARAASALLQFLGESTLVSGSNIVSSRFALSINRGCDAIEPSFLFIAAVLAFPATFRSKSIAIILGVPALMLLNLFRIISLYYVGVHAPRAFEVIHIDVWQTLFILLVMLLWFAWARRAVRTPGKESHAAA